MGLVTVARFTDPPSAYMARAMLESNGIDSFICNEHYVGMDWLHSQAVGGVELRVVQEQFERAKSLLEDPPESPELILDAWEGAEAEGESCPACYANAVVPDRTDHRVRAISLAIGIPLATGAYRYRCEACGHAWQKRPRYRGLAARLADLAALLLSVVLLPFKLIGWLVWGRRSQKFECWSCGVPFREGEASCTTCGITHPPPLAFKRVIEVGRAYDATCDACHTPYRRSDYAGHPESWLCSICRARLE